MLDLLSNGVKQEVLEQSVNEKEHEMTIEIEIGQQAESSVGHNQKGSIQNMNVHEILQTALKQVRREEGGQTVSKLSQGRCLQRLEIDFHAHFPNGDAFKALSAKSVEVPGLIQYTDRHLRNLAAFASSFDELKAWLAADAVEKGRDADMPPEASMSHYLAVNKVRELEDVNDNEPTKLTPEQKLRLLRLAEDKHWSVKHLQQQVNRELGIPPVSWDAFYKVLANAEKSIAKLTELVIEKSIARQTELAEGKGGLSAKQLTAIWHLNSLIATYSTALIDVVPEPIRNSAPTCTSAKAA